MPPTLKPQSSLDEVRITRPAPARWGIAFLLGFGVLINYFDRINLSVAQQALHAEFGISVVTFGYLLSAYSWTYALFQVPAGALLDRFGVRKVGRVSTFIWSAACFGAAAATGVGSFVAARLALGIGEAPTFPGNAKAIGEWFPRDERSFATSVFDAAAKFASAIGIPLVGLILIRFGWRATFAITGLLSLVYFFLFFFAYRDPAVHQLNEHAVTPSQQPKQSDRGASLRYLLTRRKVIGLTIGFAAYNYTFYLLLTWLPSYLSTGLHIDLLHSVVYTSVPWLIATVTDLAVGGWLVDALIRRGWNDSRVRQTVLISGMAFGIAIFGAAGAHSATQALFWISLALGGLAAAAPVAWSLPALIAPGNSVGKLGGILNFSSQVAAIAAPILTGYIVSAKKSFYGVFFAAGLFLVLGILAYAFLLGRIESIPEPTYSE
jgi:MFS family permease